MRKRERRMRSPREGDSQLFDYDLNELCYDTPVVFVNPPASSPSIEAAKPSSNGHHNRSGQALERKADKDPNPTTPPNGKPTPAPESFGHINPRDRLDPSLFLGHHRRMDREERRMQQLERQQLLVEFGRVTQQRAQLKSPDWAVYIPRIVRLVDPDDEAEAAQKRLLAIAEIDRFLTKYQILKKRRTSSIEELPTQQSPSSLSRPLKRPKKRPQPKHKPADEPANSGPPVTLSLRPTAFGFMLPEPPARPREFSLPRAWTDE